MAFDNSTTGRNLSPSSAQPWRHRKRPELEPQGDPEAGSEGQKRPELEQQDDKARRESRSDVAAITYIPLDAQRIRETTAVAHKMHLHVRAVSGFAAPYHAPILLRHVQLPAS